MCDGGRRAVRMWLVGIRGRDMRKENMAIGRRAPNVRDLNANRLVSREKREFFNRFSRHSSQRQASGRQAASLMYTPCPSNSIYNIPLRLDEYDERPGRTECGVVVCAYVIEEGIFNSSFLLCVNAAQNESVHSRAHAHE